MESMEELLQFLDANKSYDEIDKENTAQQIDEGKPILFVGQLNEPNEAGLMKISVIISTEEIGMLIRYIEPIGIAQIPQEDLMMYPTMKKDFDELVMRVEMRKKEIIDAANKQGYSVFKGVIS